MMAEKAKREVIRSQTRRKLINAIEFFRSKQVPGDSLSMAAAAFGIGRSGAIRIWHERNNPKTKTPGKDKKIPPTVTNLENVDFHLLRRTFVTMCQTNKLVTVTRLTKEFKKAKSDWKGTIRSMYRLLRKLGFRFRRQRDSYVYSVLTERNDVVAMRINYLREMMQIQSVPKEQQKQVVWLDKTCIDRINRGKRERFIIFIAGMPSGLVQNAATVFRAQAAEHRDVTAVAFRNWFVERLLPNIPPNTVIVLDSTNICSVQLDKAPSSEWKKEQIREWLDEHEITSTAQATRAELLTAVSLHKPRKKIYEIDIIAEKNGHTTLRLPPYHYDLNPVRLIWTYLKDNINQHLNKNNSVQDIQQLIDETQGNMSSDLWKETIAETTKALELYYLAIQPMDEREDKIMPLIEQSSEDDSTSDSD